MRAHALTVFLLVASCQPDDRVLLGSWDFDDVDGEIAKDQSGNDRDALLGRARRVVGRPGGRFALYLDGRDCVEVFDPAEVSSEPLEALTLTAWVRIDLLL